MPLAADQHHTPGEGSRSGRPLLVAKDLTKVYALGWGGWRKPRAFVRAVDTVDLEIREQETLCIVGESGCGKSTLARLLMGLIKPTRGELAFDGQKIGTDGMPLRDYHRQVQMVFQDSYASLNPRMAVEDTIAFGPRIHYGRPKQALARARELMSAVGLEPGQFGGRYPHELSGGQRQRINIARALAMGPRVVILDEPVSALDKSVEAQVLNLLLDLKSQLGLTYVVISHDLNVVQYLADRICVMYLGRVAELADAGMLETKYGHPYTGLLFASRPSMVPGRRREVAPLIGEPPNPINPPSGCSFHPRCPYAEEMCRTHSPPFESIGPGHFAACHVSQRDGAFQSGQSPVRRSPACAWDVR